MPSNDPSLTSRCLHLSTLGIFHCPKIWIDKVHLLPVDAARPDHAAVAEIHGLRS